MKFMSEHQIAKSVEAAMGADMIIVGPKTYARLVSERDALLSYVRAIESGRSVFEAKSRLREFGLVK